MDLDLIFNGPLFLFLVQYKWNVLFALLKSREKKIDYK